MTRSNYRACPYCGLPNIRERRTCKRCRRSLTGEPLPVVPRAATDVTGRIYRDISGQATLFLIPSMLEFSSPTLTIRTTWGNIIALRQDFSGVFLWLAEASVVPPARMIVTRTTIARQIPLTPFGYPGNRPLIADLRQFAPHLGIA